MSRSRGRGAKPKTKRQAKPDVQPFMMFQVYDGYPWVEVRWREDAVPDKLDTDSLVREFVTTIQKHIALAEKGEDEKVQVSGVPYKVDQADLDRKRPATPARVNGTDVVAPAPVYPY